MFYLFGIKSNHRFCSVYRVFFLSLGMLFFFNILIPVSVKAQENTEIVFSKILEEILRDAPEGPDYSELYDRLVSLHDQPLSLNTASREELAEIFFLNELQLDDLIAYREKYKGIMTVYELQAIKSIDLKTLQWLLFFVNTEGDFKKTNLAWRDYLNKGSNTLNFRYERVAEMQEGYRKPDSGKADNHYQGSPYKLYLRYMHKIGDKVSYGITCEKDPGEQFFQGSQRKGFDFYSFHFYKTGGKKLKTIAIGDYQVNFGQGLVFSTGMGYRFMSDYASVFRAGKEISPNRSANEYNFLRGVAATIVYKKTQSTFFYSNRRIDANLHVSDTFNNLYEDYFTSLYFSGNHRTLNEIADMKTAREQLAGGHFSYNSNKFRIGISAVGGLLSKPIEKQAGPDNYYDFSGKSFINSGVDYSFSLNHFFFYGEAGFDGNTFAVVSGMDININPKLSVALAYRNYPAAYHALYANAFRAGGTVNNEKGIYIGARFQPFRKWKISGYLDQFSLPWLSYNADMSVAGYQCLLLNEFSPGYKTKMTLRLRYDLRQENLSGNDSHLNVITSDERVNVRYEIQYKLDNNWQLETKAGFVKYDIDSGSSGNGLLLCQDISYSIMDSRLIFTGRYCIFTTDDYNSAVYIYENDVPGSFSIPVFYDKGARYFLLADYQLNKYLECWAKISRTSYFDKNTVGSGLSEIQGNHRTEMKFALMLKF